MAKQLYDKKPSDQKRRMIGSRGESNVGRRKWPLQRQVALQQFEVGAKKCPSQAGQGPTKGESKGYPPRTKNIIVNEILLLNPAFGRNRQ